LKKIALVGCGTIGSYIAKSAAEYKFATTAFVYDVDPEKAKLIIGARVLNNPAEITKYETDLVIEAATEKAVHAIAPEVLKKTDLLVFSITSLANDDFRNSLQEICSDHKTRLYIPHGAILGLDGIYDGRSLLEEVTIKTIKNPKNLGFKESVKGVLYDGPTGSVCEIFPKNVNVHAAVAVAGIGFDRTHSIVIADPEADHMTHEIRVKGKGLKWSISVASIPVGAVTGSYTPESASMTVRRILASDYYIILA